MSLDISDRLSSPDNQELVVISERTENIKLIDQEVMQLGYGAKDIGGHGADRAGGYGAPGIKLGYDQ